MSWGKCRTFSFSIEKEIRKVDKDGYEDIIEISYKIKFINSARALALSLSNLVEILQKEFIKLNAKIAIVFLNTKVSMTV